MPSEQSHIRRCLPDPLKNSRKKTVCLVNLWQKLQIIPHFQTDFPLTEHLLLHGYQYKTIILFQKTGNNFFILVIQQTAGGIHQPSPGPTSRAADSTMARRFFGAISAIVAGVWRHFRSGLRRNVPSPLQGESTRTLSAFAASRLIRASRSWAIWTGWTFDKPLPCQTRFHFRQPPVGKSIQNA